MMNSTAGRAFPGAINNTKLTHAQQVLDWTSGSDGAARTRGIHSQSLWSGFFSPGDHSKGLRRRAREPRHPLRSHPGQGRRTVEVAVGTVGLRRACVLLVHRSLSHCPLPLPPCGRWRRSATSTTRWSSLQATTVRCASAAASGKMVPQPVGNLACRCPPANPTGEMLGDHDDWGKTQPWQGSASVPLLVAGKVGERLRPPPHHR
jgi:hypothetical protein